MSLNWGDVPTWVASVGTVAAVSLALWQIASDRRRRREQEHRVQAELISGWYSGDRDHVSDLCVLNTSDQPIYEVVVTLVINNRGGEAAHEDYRRVFLDVPPGTFALEVPSTWHGMSAYPGVEVAFTDRTDNAHWIRRANGTLTEIAQSAIEHYGIGRPFHYDVAQRAPEP